jgi:hypothetical protein
MKPVKNGLRVPLPGFMVKKDIGLGHIVKRATSTLGIKPCASCAKRAAALDKWVVVGPGKRKRP